MRGGRSFLVCLQVDGRLGHIQTNLSSVDTKACVVLTTSIHVRSGNFPRAMRGGCHLFAMSMRTSRLNPLRTKGRHLILPRILVARPFIGNVLEGTVIAGSGTEYAAGHRRLHS